MAKNKSKAKSKNRGVLRLRPVIKLKRKAPGQAPGTIEHTGVQRMESVQLTVHDYSDQHCDQIAIRSIEKSARVCAPWGPTIWPMPSSTMW